MLRQAQRGTPRVLAHLAHQNPPTWPCHGVGTPVLAPGSRAMTEGLKYTKWEYLKEKVHRKEQKKKSNNHWDFPKINDWWHAIDPKSLESTNHQKCTLSLSYSNLGNIKEKENILKKARWENPPYFYRKKKRLDLDQTSFQKPSRKRVEWNF